MNSLYKVEYIEGKNLGCIALKDIKRGTLILQEKLVCYDPDDTGSSMFNFYDGVDDETAATTMIANYVLSLYQKMNQFEKVEYHKLYNRFKDPQNLTDSKKEQVDEWKNDLLKRNVPEDTANLMVDILGIYKTNSEKNGVGIQKSRFNHSCAANAEDGSKKNSEIVQIRAVSKIKAGEEITINYFPAKTSMVNFKTRQKFLMTTFEFRCICNLCKEGEIDEDIYEKFAKLDQEEQILSQKDETASLLDISTLLYRLEKMKKQVMLYKEMYQLAKEKKTSRKFILNIILEPGFQIAALLYLSSIELDEKNHDFRLNCDNFSRVGEQISADLYGREDANTDEWKKRRCDLKNWIKEKYSNNYLIAKQQFSKEVIDKHGSPLFK